jgi:hypothetical protein
MFANFFKKLIVRLLGNYIEDFTVDDIVIDKWNGQVIKENVALKKTALESLCMSLIGAPVYVVNGYIRKLKIDVPWNKLMSKPVEIALDEIHLVVKASATFDNEFAKKVIWTAKQGKLQELLDQIKVKMI